MRMCLRQAQAPRVAINITPVIERSRNHRDENKNVPSTGSGTGSSNKYNTVIERSRNHRDDEGERAFDRLRHRE